MVSDARRAKFPIFIASLTIVVIAIVFITRHSKRATDIEGLLTSTQAHARSSAGGVLTVTTNITGKAVVFVSGEVLRPQMYDIGGANKSLTVSELIEMAGGTTSFADPDKVEVERSAGGNLILTRKEAEEFVAAPHDIIRVPKRSSRFRK